MRGKDVSQNKRASGATSGFGVRSANHGKATPTPGATKGLKKSDSIGGLHTSGVSLTKLAASGKNNTDILSQLGSSHNQSTSQRMKAPPTAADDDIMREAAAALAETEAVIATRKHALVSRHVEGRESMHALDHIFDADRVKVVKDEKRFTDSLSFENYLDKHKKELEDEESRGYIRNTGPQVPEYGPRSGLADWNARMDREFGLNDLGGGANRRSSTVEDQNDVLTLDVPAQMSRAQIDSKKESDGAAVKPAVMPEPVKKDEMEELKQERDRMLAMIRQNKKMAFGEPSDDEKTEEKKVAPPEPKRQPIMPAQPKTRSRDAEILAGIGSGILRDLEASINEDQIRMDESMSLVSGRKNRKILEDDAENDKERHVRFASNISHNISASKERTHSPDEENKSSEEEQSNKLEGLNKMLRDGGLNQLMKMGIGEKESKAADFEAFMAKLAEKRKID